jgi:hypothetical protein
MEEWTDGHFYRQTDEQAKGWMDRQTDENTDRQIDWFKADKMGRQTE